ncbi:MAG: MmgE/PrpD family protein, partial [Chloroflexota bacterium]|nr:MmgE/PrpD family protein [Chloroflexota bacterium]
ITPEAVRRARARGPSLTGNAYSNFGAAAGAGRLLALSEEKMLHALGLAGHLCMVLSYGRWGATEQRYMAKYGVPGWQSTGAVAAVTLAEMGYTGDVTVLDDPERGFCNYVGYKHWYPEEVTPKLGRAWCFNVRLHYKPYPCCGAFHCGLDCFLDAVQQNRLAIEEIDAVRVFAGPDTRSPFAAHREIQGLSGAQFNPYYNVAVAAHGTPRGVEWADPGTLASPSIARFMDKVSWQGHPNYLDQLEKDPLTNLARAEVEARGKTFTVERRHRRGTAGTEAQRTDEEIIDKFKHNALRALTREQIDRAVDTLMNLESVDGIAQLMQAVTL